MHTHSHMTIKRLLLPLGVLLLTLVWGLAPAAGATEGDVVINELIQNPAAVSDGAGEWIELFNLTDTKIDINGWTIQDNDFDSHTITTETELIIPPGGFLVLGINAESTNGGESVDYEYSEFSLGNSADEVILLDGDGNVIDSVAYDGGTEFPDPNGASMALVSPFADNSVGANWCTAKTPYGKGDLGTPGAPNDCNVIEPGSIIVNEIMKDPNQVLDSAGEWFELFNTTDSDIDINGWVIQDNDYDWHLINHDGPLTVPAQGYLVLGPNDDTATNGGAPVDYAYGEGWFLGNSGDEIVLLDPVLVEIDRVEYDNGVTFPDPTGISMALRNPADNNDLGANWCESKTAYGDGDLGTPGEANDCDLVAPGSVIVNEIMQNPAAVGDDVGEWFELYNTTNSDIDLDGWIIQDNDSDKHTINTGEPVIIPAKGYLVLGVSTDTTANGGTPVDYAYGAGWFLGNGADEVVLLDANEVEIDRVNYDGGVAFPDPTGASMSLIDPGLDNNAGENWCESTTAYGDGDLGTPGAANVCQSDEEPMWVINETHADPDAVDGDANGDGEANYAQDEFVEIVNNTGSEADISGWSVSDGNGVRHVFPQGTVIPDQCAIVIFAGGTPVGEFGGALVQLASTGQLGLNNSGDMVTLSKGDSDVTSVSYGSEGGVNQSLTLDPDVIGTPPLVQHTTATNAEGRLFSPGTKVTGEIFAENCYEPQFATLEIWEIQGAAHLSTYVSQTVTTNDNIVTVVTYNGFYMQTPDARDDSNDATSNGIFVFTGSTPTVQVGDQVDVTGNVAEYRPGGDVDNLTITELTSPVITIDSSGNALPAVVVIGTGGRIPPTSVINDDGAGNVESSGSFDAASDGIDFYESLEGMRVQVNDALVVGPTNRFGEIWVVGDDGANASDYTARGGLIINPPDFNPERIQLDDDLYPGGWFNVSVGASFTQPVIGVVNYSFNNFEILVTELTTVDQSNEVTRETTALTGDVDKLTVATFNVENLGGDATSGEFAARAGQIVTNLGSPDIIVLEEMQDNGGDSNDGTVDASVTFQSLIDAIVTAGGPQYAFAQINPLDLQDGGIPGGNIRVGFLYNPARVNFVAAPAGDATTANTVSCDAGVATLDLNPGRVDPTNSAYSDSRKPLAGQFEFNGDMVYVVGVHFSSKGGDQPLYGPSQPPVLTTETVRIQQAQAVNTFVDSILACDSAANIVVLGDVNDFQFSPPVAALKGGVLVNLMDTLPANEQYSYVYQGNSQVLDQILVSNNLATEADPVYDVVHVNAEFWDQVSDHDPSVVRLTLSAPPADIAVEKVDNVADDAAVKVGEEITYTITVTNNGPGDATGVMVADTLPATASFVSVDDDACYYDGSGTGGTVSCSFADPLGNGDSYVVTIVVTGTEAGTLTNNVSASANEDDPNPDNNNASEDTTVEQIGSTLLVTKQVDWSSAVPNEAQTFEICITGPSYPDGECYTIDYNGGNLAWYDLDAGAYTVTETNPGAAWGVEIINSPVTVSGSETFYATVKNTLLGGGLTVTKAVNWGDVTPDTSTTFEICISGPSYPGGSCQIADYDGASLNWTDLAAGDYTVTETDPGSDWNVSGSGAVVSVTAGGSASATITNNRVPDTPDTGTLTVTKSVNWGSATPDTNTTFQICISGPSYPGGTCKTADYDGASLTWNGLTPGDYTVTETNPGSDWTVQGSGVSVTVPANGTGETTVINTYDPAVVECTDPDPGRDLKHAGSVIDEGPAVDGQLSGTIQNLSGTCAYDVGMASYQMFSRDHDTQILFDSQTATIKPGETLRFTVSVPDCASQVDLVYGDILPDLADGKRYNERVIDARYLRWYDWCTVDEQTP